MIYHDWCKSCDKVRYRNNGFLEQVCVYGTDAAVCGHGAGARIARLDCAANAKINLRCIYVFSVYSLPVVEFML